MTDLSLIKTYEAPEILIRENKALKVQNKILMYTMIGIALMGVFFVIKEYRDETN
ncbi:hypothetical protein DEU42_102114 [Flavobacterium sp. AG291]|nr:hypothetical protein DEU42_102114 [Flavobacterium sp. AG291]